ncbi:IgGFc-binding protein [Pseudenhygromyxa sp. WMMC2535]|uniref:IgGFc-binding protein n=1 Tax=Pseudenhygromyxa sp. WMMC2535 TaxID=2712867 RepID=UPI0015542116|nr:IgGFc-binding protein [Pseudenhygromyxa sp. WMMC2535]NVB37201.1 IgGFc-binding protein [Pseudenhygromyxa sp. WMMC2535]
MALRFAAPAPFTGLLALASLTLPLTLAGCPAAEEEGSSESSVGEDDDVAPDDEVGQSEDDSPQIICVPGETQCESDTVLETCAATGLEWEQSFCGTNDSCMACSDEDPDCTGAVCVGPCELTEELPSSAGCSFYAAGMMINTGAEGVADAIVVGNPNEDASATVQRYLVPIGSNLEEAVGEPVLLEPGETVVFEFEEDLTENKNNGAGTSKLQSGGMYHVVSDLPVIAYQHSPYEETATNESSLLLPEDSAREDFVIFAYDPFAEPSYFNVIALENQTTVWWNPTIETAGNNLPLPFVEVGQTGEYTMNRHDLMRIAASANLGAAEYEQDLSGTVVWSDKPILVMAGVVGIKVPYCATGTSSAPDGCYGTTDHVQEQVIPLDYWGEEYVCAHSPTRADEEHYWRVFAGDDNVTVTAEPAVDGSPFHFESRGDWVEFSVPNGTDFVLSGDGPFMPVQYTARHLLAGGIGDAAMYQMIPTAQFLERYLFVTAEGYDLDYVQVIRTADSAEVMLDGSAVTGYEAVGNYEVATVQIVSGAHDIQSEDPFGILQVGYVIANYPNGLDAKATKYPAAYGYPGA